MERNYPTVAEYRQYWMARITPDPNERRGCNWDMEKEFWLDAGFDEYKRGPFSPPKVEGLEDLVRDIYDVLLAPGSKANWPEEKPWVHLAHSLGLLTDELWLQITRVKPYLWSRYEYLVPYDRAADVRYHYGNQEPAPGTNEAFQLNHKSTLADKATRQIDALARSFEPDFQQMLAVTSHFKKERLLLACGHIERLQVSSLTREDKAFPHRHEALSKMAASEFTIDEPTALAAELEVFAPSTLFLVEEFATSARTILRDLLTKRPGWREMLRLRDSLRALFPEGDDGFGEATGLAAELHAGEFRKLIAAVPTDLFQWFRATYADNVPEAMVLDALQGLNGKKLETSIKRHSQMAIKCHAMLPLPEGQKERDKEVLRRYLMIEEFVRGSKKFGTQRQAKNRVCADVARTNLALNAGYDDADELFFDIESKLAANAADARFATAGYEVSISYSVEGPSLVVVKDGKALKSVPPAVKNTDGFKELKEMQEALRAQSGRFRRALEKRMALGSPILPDQLAAMVRAPLVREMISRLVWIDANDQTGLLDEDGATLVAVDGKKLPLGPGPVRIAHPVEMERLGVLPAWRDFCFAKELVQPVRQVFREFYVLTPAEIETSPESFRFANHGLSTGPLSGLMKTRGWSVSGMEPPVPRKLFGAAGIKAFFDLPNIGHYLTESDIVGTGAIYFENPKEEKLPLETVPETIFSEVMRDADLFVSVAQAGAEHTSSKELIVQRQALLIQLVQKLKLKGVSQEGPHAVIEGTRAVYRVHLASGAVFIGIGRHLCIVPAGSWKTPAKLFLPFYADDDKRIAEVFSKILLLSRDDKITDPSILSQISAALG